MDDLGASVILQARGWTLRPAGGQWEILNAMEQRIAGPAADWPTMVIAQDAAVTGAALAKKYRQAAAALNWFYGTGVNVAMTLPAQTINRPYELHADAVGASLPDDLRYSMWRRVNTNRANDTKATGDHVKPLGAIEELMDNLGLSYALIAPAGFNGG